MTKKFNPELHFSAMEATMGLKVEGPWKANVMQHLSIAAELAELINRAPLPDGELELANVFTPQCHKKQQK